MRISKVSGKTVYSEAFDRIDGKVSAQVRKRTLAALKSKKRHETFGLAHAVSLKIGIKYMVFTNVDVEDGLVNGACGVLKYIEFDEKNPKKPKTLFLEFDSNRIGVKAKREYVYDNTDIDQNWVPIKRIAREISMSKGSKFQVFRTQFPVTPAEALTIHKAQGSTMEWVCVNVHNLTRELLYAT